MLIQILMDTCNPVKRRKKWSSKRGTFYLKMLDICKPVNRRKDIEKTQFNNSFAFSIAVFIKSNLAKKT